MAPKLYTYRFGNDPAATEAAAGSDVSLLRKRLEAFLQTVPFERTGRNLYIRYCQACHGGNARGTSRGSNIRREQDDIYSAVSRGRRNMPAFPELSTADVTLIRAYINSLP